MIPPLTTYDQTRPFLDTAKTRKPSTAIGILAVDDKQFGFKIPRRRPKPEWILSCCNLKADITFRRWQRLIQLASLHGRRHGRLDGRFLNDDILGVLLCRGTTARLLRSVFFAE